MNLLTKLNDELKRFAKTVGKSKIVRGGLAFAMGLTIAMGASACTGKNPNNTKDPDHTITDPNGDDNPQTKYSQILQNVLDSDYYNGLIEMRRNKTILSESEKRSLEPIPYGFLAKQGFDVNELIQSENEVTSYQFIRESEPNSLYCALNVETKANPNYFTNYYIKYDLTQKEVDDLNMLFGGIYIQAFFFIQELSNQKTPTIVSQCNMSVDAYNGLLENLNKTSELKTKYKDGLVMLVFEDFDEYRPNNYLINLKYISKNKETSNKKTTTLGDLQIVTFDNSGGKVENGLFVMRYPNRFSLYQYEEMKSEKITTFSDTVITLRFL